MGSVKTPGATSWYAKTRLGLCCDSLGQLKRSEPTQLRYPESFRPAESAALGVPYNA